MALPNVCPKCLIGLAPKEEGEKVFITCPNCGYRREVTELTEHDCSKCGCGKAALVYFGVIIGDEMPLSLYKCVRCGHVDREGMS